MKWGIPWYILCSFCCVFSGDISNIYKIVHKISDKVYTFISHTIKKRLDQSHTTNFQTLERVLKWSNSWCFDDMQLTKNSLSR